jgi:hypothetical protein
VLQICTMTFEFGRQCAIENDDAMVSQEVLQRHGRSVQQL